MLPLKGALGSPTSGICARENSLPGCGINQGLTSNKPMVAKEKTGLVTSETELQKGRDLHLALAPRVHTLFLSIL
jgi:hypothetical protein